MTSLARPAIAVAVVMDRETKPNRWEDWRHSVADVVLDEGGFGFEPTVLRDDGQRRSTVGSKPKPCLLYTSPSPRD